MKERSAEFEEGEFRGPLFNQLMRGNHLLWEPGQVFEQHIGIDYAGLVDHEFFWRLRGCPPHMGVALNSLPLGYIGKKRKKGKTLPPFKLNVFIQAKRSNYTALAPKKARDNGLASTSWFFNVEPHQQDALNRLSSALGGQGLVCYAAPAFDKQSELYTNIELRTMVQNSTFPAAGKLTGHGRWYYDRAGRFGVANPDFERIEIASMEEQISKLIEHGEDSPERLASENLLALVQAVNRSIETADEISSTDTWFSHLAQLYESEAESLFGDVTEALRSYLRIKAYCSAHKLEWLTIK